MEYRADMHIHSSFSDGSMSPEDILYLAKDVGLSAISITDHDSINAYSKELFSLAEKLKIDLITGIEVSSSLRKETIHILGYNFDYRSETLINFLTDVQKKRDERNLLILEKLSKQNIYISQKELYENQDVKTTIGRPHIALLMIKKGFVKDFKAAFNLYLKDGASCFVEGQKYAPDIVIDLIHKAGGKAILAHPQQIECASVLNDLFDMNFDGLEAYYGKMVLHKEKRWIRKAKARNWLITGGSDFHGANKPFINLGSSWITEEHVNLLKK